MKKKIITLLAVLVIIALTVGLWFYGHYYRKSNDNIPSKELMAAYYFEKGEDYATKKLEGYKKSQIEAVWGEPQGFLFGMWGDVWDVDESTYIIVYYHTDKGYGIGDGIVDFVKVSERDE